MERTFIILKPDCMEKRLYGECLSRFARLGVQVVACKLAKLSPDILREHYAHITDKPFYPDLEGYMMSRPVLMLVLEGPGIIERMRKIIGPTDSAEAAPGTIRGDMGVDKSTNVIHASDGPESATVEIARFFRTEEIF